MRKLADIRGEDALDVLADILEPAAEIMTDDEFKRLMRANKKLKAIKVALKQHKFAVLTILAVMDGEDVSTYSPGLAVLPIKLLELLNDPDMIQVFYSQSPNEDGKTSGSATVTIEATEIE